MMKAILIVLVISILFGSFIAASGQKPLELSTLQNKPAMEPIKLPKLSPILPTAPPTALGGNVNKTVVDLSTLGRKAMMPVTPAVVLKASTPITVTPSFSIKNTNITGTANTVLTPPQAISANSTVYTPPIAIFGGA